MDKDTLREAVRAIQELMFYNQILAREHGVVVLYLHPLTDDPEQKQESRQFESRYPQYKAIPFERRHEVLPLAEGIDGFAQAMATYDAFLEVSQKEGTYKDSVTRLHLLFFIYTDLIHLASAFRCDAIKKLLELEQRLYDFMPIDVEAFMAEEKKCKEASQDMSKWSYAKKAIYMLLEFFERECVYFHCDGLMTLKDKILAMNLTDASPEMEHIYKEHGRDFTAAHYIGLYKSEGFYRAAELRVFYLFVEYQAKIGQTDNIAYLFSKEDAMYTMPIEWLEKYRENLQEEVMPEEMMS